MDAVQFDQVSKRYRLGQRTTAREAIMGLAARAVGRGGADRDSDIWSLRDVSFSVGAGEALGIVGRNGAGKSTVLKILAGITSPTSGVSRSRGRVAALLEVGTGFHSELTGRENVYLNGTILGMTRRDIDRHFDEIVAFSGVERFLDTPVKRFSSGMYLRLAFAVAAHLDPDILVVDEVLAVGDAEFQRKCIGRMHEAEQEGRTVLFVSHDMEALSKLCSRALWLDGGRLRESGRTDQVVRNYLGSGLPSAADSPADLPLGPAVLRSAALLHENGLAAGAFMCAEPLRLALELDVLHDVPGLDLAVYVTRDNGTRVFDEMLSDNSTARLSAAGSYRVELEIPPVLNAGTYSVGLCLETPYEMLADQSAVGTFTVNGGDPERGSRAVVLNIPFRVSRLEQAVER